MEVARKAEGSYWFYLKMLKVFVYELHMVFLKQVPDQPCSDIRILNRIPFVLEYVNSIPDVDCFERRSQFISLVTRTTLVLCQRLWCLDLAMSQMRLFFQGTI